MAKSIPTSAQWKKEREHTFKLPKGYGPSLGKLLDAYHKSKEKGGKAILAALATLRKVVVAYPDTPKVRLYFVEKRLEVEQQLLEKYFEELLRKIDNRVKKLKKYEQVVKSATNMTLDDVLASGKIRLGMFAFAKSEFNQENYEFVVMYDAMGIKPNANQGNEVERVMKFLDAYVIKAALNIPSGQMSELKEWRRQKNELTNEAMQKKQVLWKELCEALALARYTIWKLMESDVLPRFKKSPQFKDVVAQINNVYKWDA